MQSLLYPSHSTYLKPKLIQLYESKVPRLYRELVKPWWFVGGFATIVANFAKTEEYTTLVAVYWSIICVAYVTQKIVPVKHLLKQYPWLIALVYGPMSVIYTLPVYAQVGPGAGAGACQGGGIFQPISNFVATTFASFTITSAQGTVGNLSNFLCGMIAILFLAAIVVFLGGGAWVTGQLMTGTPLTVLVGPISGILFFVAMVVAILTLLIGAS